MQYNGETGKKRTVNGGNVSDVTVGGISVVNQQGVAEIPAIPDGLHHYSTTEHVIGTWIDGKPLYEKVFAFSQRTTISEGSWVDTEFLTGDISVVVFVSGIDIQSNKGTAWHFLGADVTGTYIKLYQNRDLSKNIALTHFIMQYTKTTD